MDGRGVRMIWVVSYPKSGSTWVRAFLANLIHGGVEPLRLQEIVDLWKVYHKDAGNLVDGDMVRIHRLPHGLTIPPRTVYVVRDPRDVAVSWAAHYGVTIGRAIRTLNSKEPMAPRADRVVTPPAKTADGSWSGHTAAWGLAAPNIFRYEDMIADPLVMFTGLAHCLTDTKYGDRAIRRAIDHSRFHELQAQEDRDGFAERPPSCKRFFRRGQAGGWRNVLTKPQARKIETANRAMMERFGYLDKSNE